MGIGKQMQEALEAQYERGRKAGLREVLVLLDAMTSQGIPGRARWIDNLTGKIEVMLLSSPKEAA